MLERYVKLLFCSSIFCFESIIFDQFQFEFLRYLTCKQLLNFKKVLKFYNFKKMEVVIKTCFRERFHRRSGCCKPAWSRWVLHRGSPEKSTDDVRVVNWRFVTWLPGSRDTENDWKIPIYGEVFLEHERNFRDCETEGLVYGKPINFDDRVWWGGS